jgi:hypothetical protein
MVALRVLRSGRCTRSAGALIAGSLLVVFLVVGFLEDVVVVVGWAGGWAGLEREWRVGGIGGGSKEK